MHLSNFLNWILNFLKNEWTIYLHTYLDNYILFEEKRGKRNIRTILHQFFPHMHAESRRIGSISRNNRVDFKTSGVKSSKKICNWDLVFKFHAMSCYLNIIMEGGGGDPINYDYSKIFWICIRLLKVCGIFLRLEKMNDMYECMTHKALK